LVIKKGMAFGCCVSPHGPETVEVLQEDRRPVPGVTEEKVKAWLKNEVGIKTSGYKCYYTDVQYY